MPLPAPRLPPVARPLLALGDGLARVGLDPMPVDPDALLAAASRATGLTDFGGDVVREGVEVLCRSALDEGRLHVGGRYHLRWLLRRVLVTRLRLVALKKARPDLVRPSRPPLFVCGLPRSGTTALHRLLAAAEDARPLALYELLEPFRGPGPDRRLAQTDRRLRGVTRLAPISLDAQHLMRGDLPDECSHLLMQGLRTMMLYQFPAPAYTAWYLAADHRDVYADHAVLLALLEDPARRLVLKDPWHFGHLAELTAAMPDAMIVQTHRDPVQTVPSLCQLMYTAQATLTHEVDVAACCAATQRVLDVGIERNLHFRDHGGAGRILDVDYGALLADPVGLVRSIHRHFGLPWTEATERRVRAHAAENPQYKHGRTPYAPEDFGMTREGLAARYAVYRERFVPGARSAVA